MILAIVQRCWDFEEITEMIYNFGWIGLSIQPNIYNKGRFLVHDIQNVAVGFALQRSQWPAGTEAEDGKWLVVW